MGLRIQDERFERATRDYITAYQLERLQKLLNATAAKNDFYREHWRTVGATSDILSIEEFTARIPVVRKADFMADQQRKPPFGLRVDQALESRAPLMVCTTSGTSGQGVEVHTQTRAEADVAREVYAYLFRWAGLERGDSIFLNYPITMLGGGRIEMNGLEGYGLSVYPVGNYDVGRKLELMERFQPKAIMATTSYLGHLAAASTTSPPCKSVTALLGGGEGGGFSWFERLENDWQASVFNHYGATQTRVDNMFPCENGLGTRDHPGMLHNIDPYFLLEVIDAETGRQVADGEAGEIVLTSLFHDEVPMIRCAMGDRAVYREPGYCNCGRPFCGIEIGTISRIDDRQKVKGINIWPQAVDDVLFDTPQVDEYQIVLTSSASEADVATLRVMPLPNVPAALLESCMGDLTQRLRERIGISFKVELLEAGTLARSEYKARRWIDERVHTQ
jgi:phenylacetate-CoA ligase